MSDHGNKIKKFKRTNEISYEVEKKNHCAAMTAAAEHGRVGEGGEEGA